MAVVTTEYKTPWFAVKKSVSEDGKSSPFYFTIRKPKVVILPYFSAVEDKFHLVLLEEPISTWGADSEIVALTGTIDEAREPIDQTAVRELYEETGIICHMDSERRWTHIGNFTFDKGTSSQNHLYLVDVGNCTLGERKTDGSWFEANTKLCVLPEDDHRIRYSKDIYLHFLLTQLRLLKGSQNIRTQSTLTKIETTEYGETSQVHTTTKHQGAIVNDPA